MYVSGNPMGNVDPSGEAGAEILTGSGGNLCDGWNVGGANPCSPVESFVSILVYAGDTGDKWGYFDKVLLSSLGVEVDAHGEMPDVIFHYAEKNWLLLVESGTSHGPVDSKRHAELDELFADSRSGLVYVTAFPNRVIMGRYLREVAWETEVWVADAHSHRIHFNGDRFLGPHTAE